MGGCTFGTARGGTGRSSQWNGVRVPNATAHPSKVIVPIIISPSNIWSLTVGICDSNCLIHKYFCLFSGSVFAIHVKVTRISIIIVLLDLIAIDIYIVIVGL